MKIFDGVMFYTVTEVAQMCKVTTQSLKGWMKASEKKAEAGEERLIPPPRIEPNGYKYWSAEDAQKIVEYASLSHKERYGNLRTTKEGS